MIDTTPTPSSTPNDVDALIQQTQRRMIVNAAAIVAAAAGVFLLLVTFQLWDLVTFRGPYKAIPVTLGLFGATSMVFALKIFRQRVWAAVGGAAFFGVTALGSVGLLGFVLGPISLAGFLVPTARDRRCGDSGHRDRSVPARGGGQAEAGGSGARYPRMNAMKPPLVHER
jgi:hypothetical protein